MFIKLRFNGSWVDLRQHSCLSTKSIYFSRRRQSYSLFVYGIHGGQKSILSISMRIRYSFYENNNRSRLYISVCLMFSSFSFSIQSVWVPRTTNPFCNESDYWWLFRVNAVKIIELWSSSNRGLALGSAKRSLILAAMSSLSWHAWEDRSSP